MIPKLSRTSERANESVSERVNERARACERQRTSSSPPDTEPSGVLLRIPRRTGPGHTAPPQHASSPPHNTRGQTSSATHSPSSPSSPGNPPWRPRTRPSTKPPMPPQPPPSCSRPGETACSRSLWYYSCDSCPPHPCTTPEKSGNRRNAITHDVGSTTRGGHVGATGRADALLLPRRSSSEDGEDWEYVYSLRNVRFECPVKKKGGYIETTTASSRQRRHSSCSRRCRCIVVVVVAVAVAVAVVLSFSLLHHATPSRACRPGNPTSNTHVRV